jgi:hypothetical protein
VRASLPQIYEEKEVAHLAGLIAAVVRVVEAELTVRVVPPRT